MITQIMRRPGPSAERNKEMCRGVSLRKIWRILPGIFLEDFSDTFSHKNEEKKSGDKIREKNPVAQK